MVLNLVFECFFLEEYILSIKDLYLEFLFLEVILLFWNYFLYICMIEISSNYIDVIGVKIFSIIENRFKCNIKGV